MNFDGIDRDPQGMRDIAKNLSKSVTVIEEAISRMTQAMKNSAVEMDDKMQEAADAFTEIRPKLQEQLDKYMELARRLTTNADRIDEIRGGTHF